MEQARFAGSGESQLALVAPVVDMVPGEVAENPVAMPLAVKKQLLDEYNEIIWGTPQVQTSTIGYADSRKKVIFLSSAGSYIKQERADIALRLTAIAAKDGEVQQVGLSLGSRGDFNAIQGLHQQVEVMAKHAVALLSAPQVKGGDGSCDANVTLGPSSPCPLDPLVPRSLVQPSARLGLVR